jgi:protein-S-isoprenylcysteine O-methyltransferase Ste14
MKENEHHRSGVHFPPPLIFAGALAAGFLLHRAWPAPIVASAGQTILHVAGGLRIALGMGLVSSAIRAFPRAGTNVNPTQPATALVVTGPYRFTRNPMYVSLTAASGGIALLTNGWWPLVLLLPALLLVRCAVIAREERYLEARFGDAYRQYTRRVRRWV